MIYLEKNQVPALLRGFYNGTKFRAEITDHVQCLNMQWDGGSRNTYTAINLGTGEHKPIVDERPWPENMGGGPQVDLALNLVVCKHSTFQGKDMGLTFYIHPDNAPQYLPTPEELPEDERIVLAFTAGLKSSYGGIKAYRFHEANRKHGITRERWEAAKTRLIASGHLRKNGAITPKGRNVETHIRVH